MPVERDTREIEVEHALIEADLFDGYPEARAKMAASLVMQGLNAAHVTQLATWGKKTFTRTAYAKSLAKTLSDPKRTNQVLADLKRVASIRKPQAAPGESERQSPVEPAEWDERDKARRMAALVDSDRKSMSDAARVLGISLSEAPPLLEQGRAMRSEVSRDTTPDKPEESHKDRVDRFRRVHALANEKGIPWSEARRQIDDEERARALTSNRSDGRQQSKQRSTGADGGAGKPGNTEVAEGRDPQGDSEGASGQGS